jgi:tetratricopeptide (TPR) repeat protein
MKRVKRQLDSAGVANRMEVFEGGHDWPPSEYCTRAIEWMELQGMKRGRRPKDDALLQEMINKRLNEANAARMTARPYDEYGVYDALAYDFKGLRDVTEYEKKLVELKETKEVKQALKQDRDMESEQQRRVNEIVMLRRRLETNPPARPPNNEAFGDATETRVLVVSDLRRKIAELTKKARSAESSPERTLARRVVNQVLVWWYEDSMRYIQHKRYDLAVASLSLDAQVMPDNPRVLFRLATAYSLNNDKKRAIETLKKAVEKGFNDVTEIESNAALAPLRQDGEYKKIVDGIGKGKT